MEQRQAAQVRADDAGVVGGHVVEGAREEGRLCCGWGWGICVGVGVGEWMGVQCVCACVVVLMCEWMGGWVRGSERPPIFINMYVYYLKP